MPQKWLGRCVVQLRVRTWDASTSHAPLRLFFVPGKLTPKEIKFPVQNWQSILFNFNRTETALPSADTSAWLWQDKSRPYLLNDLLETEKTKKSGHVRKHNTPILYSTNRKLRPPAAMNASGGLNLFEKRFKNPKTLKWGEKIMKLQQSK